MPFAKSSQRRTKLFSQGSMSTGVQAEQELSTGVQASLEVAAHVCIRTKGGKTSKGQEEGSLEFVQMAELCEKKS